MAFVRPTLSEIAERVKTDITSRAGVGSPLRRSFISAISFAIAGAVHLAYGFLSFIARQVFPDTAEAEFLERWASIWGVTRRQASFAEGDVQFTGTNGSVIPLGTILVRADGLQYRVQADATIAAGIATVNVLAEVAGSGSSLQTDGKLTLVTPIAGVQSEGTVLSSNKVNGADQETDEALRARLLDRIQRPPNGGSENDYKQWALEVPGVTRAWVYPGSDGLGTVGIAFVTDNEDNIIPTTGKVEEVQEYIDERRPVTAEAVVFAPSSEELDFEIQLSPNNASVREAVTSELADLIRRESEPGGTLLISRIREAISIAAGESDHVLVSPTANVVTDPGTLKILGEITFTIIP